MTKRHRDLVRELEQLGYAYDHTNCKGVAFWVHEDTGAQVRLPTGCDETAARRVLTEARHQIGLPTKTNKRNPAQIRERNAAEHERAARDLAAARRDLDAADERGLRAAEEAFLRADRKFRYWDRLMRQSA